MLTRVDVDAFEATTGSAVRLMAIARLNGGAESITFTYAGKDLDPVDIHGHPGGELTAVAGKKVFRCVATAGTPAGVYDLFEVLEDESEVDLEEEIDLTFGPIHQFFISGASAGVMKAAKAVSKRAAAKKAPKKATAKKAVPKKPAIKKRATKKPAVKKAVARKAVAKKRSAAKRTPPKRRRR